MCYNSFYVLQKLGFSLVRNISYFTSVEFKNNNFENNSFIHIFDFR